MAQVLLPIFGFGFATGFFSDLSKKDTAIIYLSGLALGVGVLARDNIIKKIRGAVPEKNVYESKKPLPCREDNADDGGSDEHLDTDFERGED